MKASASGSSAPLLTEPRHPVVGPTTGAAVRSRVFRRTELIAGGRMGLKPRLSALGS